MCDPFGPLPGLIHCRCKGLNELFRKLSERGHAPRSLEFLNRIDGIKRQAEKQPEEANRLLDLLMGELKEASDGTGGCILSGERYQEFISCDSSAEFPQVDG
jgi:hypothetical protein